MNTRLDIPGFNSILYSDKLNSEICDKGSNSSNRSNSLDCSDSGLNSTPSSNSLDSSDSGLNSSDSGSNSSDSGLNNSSVVSLSLEMSNAQVVFTTPSLLTMFSDSSRSSNSSNSSGSSKMSSNNSPVSNSSNSSNSSNTSEMLHLNNLDNFISSNHTNIIQLNKSLPQKSDVNQFYILTKNLQNFALLSESEEMINYFKTYHYYYNKNKKDQLQNLVNITNDPIELSLCFDLFFCNQTQNKITYDVFWDCLTLLNYPFSFMSNANTIFHKLFYINACTTHKTFMTINEALLLIMTLKNKCNILSFTQYIKEFIFFMRTTCSDTISNSFDTLPNGTLMVIKDNNLYYKLNRTDYKRYWETNEDQLLSTLFKF